MRSTDRRTLIKSVVIAVSIIVFSTTVVMAAEFVSVVKDGVNLRSGPTTKNEVLFQLPAGYPLKVLSRKGKWLKVSDFENDKGWVFSSLVSKTPYVIVKVKECNARSGPGTSYKKIGTFAREVILKKIGRKGEWLKVSHPQLTGWVHSKLVWP